MKRTINKEIFERKLGEFVKNTLIGGYNSIKDNPNPKKMDVKFLIYHAIAYFQYLNLLAINQAVELYINYILSEGKQNSLVDKFYFFDGIERRIKANEISIPLYFDDLLNEVSRYLMNYKQIVRDVTIDAYKKYFREKYNLNPSDITLYAIINLLEDIKIYTLIALKRHWITINKEILPFLLKKTLPIGQAGYCKRHNA